MTALVGPSGGGKSTILNLILRFYEVDGGAIVIDGQNIATVSRHSLRSQIAYVGQDVFLFRGSVRDNIALGRPDATEAEIVAAAKAAYAHDFIMAFPRGYDTPVGEHGLQVAGGERQRIAVARALLKDAPIILLDEATASLDSESERQVQRAIERLCAGAHHDRDRAPPAHRRRCRSHLRDRGRHGRRIRPPRRAAAQGRPLRLVLPPAAARPGAERRRSPIASIRLSSAADRKRDHERRRQELRHPAAAAGRHRGRRHRQGVSGAPHLVRRPQLRRAHPRDGARRARPAVLLRQARRRHRAGWRRPCPIRRSPRTCTTRSSWWWRSSRAAATSSSTRRSTASGATASASTSRGATCRSPRAT